jgi:hypothetical protein
MKSKDYALRIAGTIFAVVCFVHLFRIITGVSVVIGEWPLPVWINWMGFIGTAVLSGWLWWISFRKE